MSEAAVLNAVLFLPLLGTGLIVAAPAGNPVFVRRLALAVMIVQFVLAAWLYARFDSARSGLQFETRLPWIAAWGVYYQIGLDGYNVLLVMLTAFLGPLVVAGAFTAIAKDEKLFYAMVFLVQFAMLGTFVAQDLFLFYFFWETMLIPMFLLIGIWGGARREYAAWKFLIYTFTASAFTLAGIFLLYFQTGAVSGAFEYLSSQIAQSKVVGTLPFFGAAVSLPLVIFLFLFVAFAVKLPMWPVHTWLPDAHTEAPTAVSVLLAGVLLKMGAYGLIRICLGFVPIGATEFASTLAIFAAINVLWGAGASMVQQDMKKMIAYSSVSHMGYVLLGVAGAAAAAGAFGAGTASAANLQDFREAALTGAALQMFTHGTITGMLFFAVGVLYDKAHIRDIDAFGGIAKRMPMLTLLFSIACFASLGLPALSGFVSEYLVFTGTYALLPVPTILCAFGVVLTAGYLLWMLRRSFFGPLNMKWSGLTDATALQAFPLIALAVVIFLVGIFPGPIMNVLGPSLHYMVVSMQQVVAP
jgi:NADH-quinone oxidoreductase subunit M